MAILAQAAPPAANPQFTRTWRQQTGPAVTPAAPGGSTRPASGQMYPRTK